MPAIADSVFGRGNIKEMIIVTPNAFTLFQAACIPTLLLPAIGKIILLKNSLHISINIIEQFHKQLAVDSRDIQ